VNDTAKRNIHLLEQIQQQYEHPERFTLPLPTPALLDLVASGSAAITLPGSGNLWLTIVALPAAPVTVTAEK
jgi:hypothetical protein